MSPPFDGRYLDVLETRPPEQRESETFAALRALLRCAAGTAPALAAQLNGVDIDTLRDRAALAGLPLLRKCALIERQQAAPPLGGLAATPPSQLARLFMSPGPIFEPEGRSIDGFRFARALHAAGFRAGELIHNTFAYHLSPAGFMVEGGAAALGCPVFPAGTGQTELQLGAIAHLRPTGYAGTPSFLKALLERGRDSGVDTSSLKKALVSGEALPRSLALELRQAFGVDAYQCYATADVGLIAYETYAREGLVVDEKVLVEIVRPDSGEPVSDGEIGEVVVSVLNPDYPLLRFATGDLSAFMPATSPCGRTNRRLRGWLGRADQVTKVKGMFVHPRQIDEVVARHAGVLRARLVVEREGDLDRMTLLCEVERGEDTLVGALEDDLRATTRLRGKVVLVAPGALADDGKVIDDRRDLR